MRQRKQLLILCFATKHFEEQKRAGYSWDVLRQFLGQRSRFMNDVHKCKAQQVDLVSCTKRSILT